MNCNRNNLILILTLILTLTLADPVTPCFIRPLVNKLANRERTVGGFVGGALPDRQLFFATISSHVRVDDKLSGAGMKTGVWVGYNTK